MHGDASAQHTGTGKLMSDLEVVEHESQNLTCRQVMVIVISIILATEKQACLSAAMANKQDE